ncbi:hypothetical protein DC522_01545 [Microvirga sp. KLBC 81]|uniref:hypothetical protein n=1 Tax=Microvirga sp. KLBC 81 TaxID=1862707 RepID=UPI000D5212E5|nr:hypothetical protein [Microvirga sp. KLBC 81]PVE25952.1 hypothetical protein DC522_01545 [Microvirga sp. KLBC 81]
MSALLENRLKSEISKLPVFLGRKNGNAVHPFGNVNGPSIESWLFEVFVANPVAFIQAMTRSASDLAS